MQPLDRVKIRIDNSDISDDDIEEYEQLTALYYDGEEDVVRRMNVLYNKIFHPNGDEKLIAKIEEALELASLLSRVETDEYAICVEALLEALATVK